jgi:hypothetical protein
MSYPKRLLFVHYGALQFFLKEHWIPDNEIAISSAKFDFILVSEGPLLL